MTTPIAWPERESAAPWHDPDTNVVVCLTIDVDAESPVLARGEHYANHLSTMSHQAFGPRQGVPRLLEVVRDAGLEATFFIPGIIAERWPQVVDAVLTEGHELALHGYTHRHPVHLSVDEQRREVDRALEVLTRAGGRPVGYRAPNWEITRETLDYLATCGLVYDSSLMDGDKPYRLLLEDGMLAELPPHWGLDDWEQYFFVPEPDIGNRIVSPTEVLEMWSRELDAMRRWGGLFVLTLHPFLSGRAGRAQALAMFIEYASSFPDVKFATCRQVAEVALAAR